MDPFGSAWFWSLALLLSAVALAYIGAGWFSWGVVVLALAGGFTVYAEPPWWAAAGVWAVLAASYAVLAVPHVRCRFISARLLERFDGAAGASPRPRQTVWTSGVFRPQRGSRSLLEVPLAQLTAAERDYLSGPVERFCQHRARVGVHTAHGFARPESWKELAKAGLLGLDLPADLGGRGFSPAAQASLVLKLASADLGAALCVGAPGAALARRLLLDFGDDTLKQRHLPGLARGEERLALVAAASLDGSIAAGAVGRVTVRPGQREGDALGLEIDFEQDCVELAPVATLFVVIANLSDPEGLLEAMPGSRRVALVVPAGVPGVSVTPVPELMQLGLPYGRVVGQAVYLPLECMLRPPDGSEGLADYLEDVTPWALFWSSVCTAATKIGCRSAGAIARISGHWQLGQESEEAPAEKLGRIALDAYGLNAARKLTLAVVSSAGTDSTLMAMMKVWASVSSRRTITDVMGIHGAALLALGPDNRIAEVHRYPALAVSLGGNDQLLRTDYVFQRALAAQHPWFRELCVAAGIADAMRLKGFDREVGHALRRLGSLLARSLLYGLSGGLLVPTPVRCKGLTAYVRQIERQSMALAIVNDLLLLRLGAGLLQRQRVTARMTDIMAELFVALAAIREFGLGDQDAAELPLARQTVIECLRRARESLDELLHNSPLPWLRRLVRVVAFPFGWPVFAPDDEQALYAAENLVVPSTVRDRLSAGIYLPADPADILFRLDEALSRVNTVASLEAKLRHAERIGLITGVGLEEKLASAAAARLLSERDAALIRETRELCRDVLSLQEFARQPGLFDRPSAPT